MRGEGGCVSVILADDFFRLGRADSPVLVSSVHFLLVEFDLLIENDEGEQHDVDDDDGDDDDEETLV